MDFDAIFKEPALRRVWLLNKALESASLEDALKLAQAADEFLSAEKPTAKASLPIKEVFLRGLSAHHKPESDLPIPLPLGDLSAVGLVTLSHEKSHDSEELADGPIDATTEIEDPQPVGAYGTRLGQAAEGIAGIASAVIEDIDEEEAPEAGTLPQSGAEADLAVLASLDDVVRYLRQRDDVVVSAGPGLFLVNGRFHLDADELLLRANKMRQRQGKPQFQRIPLSFATASDRNFVDGAAK